MRILDPEPGRKELAIASTPAIRPCKAAVKLAVGTDLIFSPVTDDTAPVTSLFFPVLANHNNVFKLL